jgi:hypothetical protein
MGELFIFPENNFVMNFVMITKGKVIIIIALIIIPETRANRLQYLAPIVLGIISEKTNIIRVRMADIIPKYISPNILVACAPTPAAPIVCAIVFRERIADSGFSILFFNLIKIDADL